MADVRREISSGDLVGGSAEAFYWPGHPASDEGDHESLDHNQREPADDQVSTQAC